MITNERQFRISKSQFERLQAEAGAFDMQEAVKRTGSAILAQAELAALQSQAEDLSAQLHEYAALKSGMVTTLKARSISELPSLLIRARIAQGLSQRGLARRLGLKEQQIQRYEAEEYSTASIRRFQEVANALTLNISEVAELMEGALPRKVGESKEPIDWSLFPIKEMYSRHWFEDFSGSLTVATLNADLLVGSFVTNVVRRPMLALHRKRVRSGSTLDPYALLAWQCRILTLAKSVPLQGPYKPGTLSDEWLRELVRLSRFENGPVRARGYLENAGIALVIEAHLSSTHLDGAALLGDRGPVIGLTLRHDRMDNFWFVLLHELIHVEKHLHKGRIEDVFDDMDAVGDELERRVDALASHALIPEDSWETALARYVRSESAVRSCAEELMISPAIVAGRIRNEADNYVILRDLVGQGKVRKLFPEIRFG